MTSRMLVAFLISLTALAAPPPAWPKLIHAAQGKSQMPALSVALQMGHSPMVVWAEGRVDRDSPRRLRPTDRMPAGSVGKTFVAALVLQEVESGRISLDAPLHTWFGAEPWFRALPNAETMTVRMLLQHTAGLQRHEFKPAFHAALARDPDKTWRPQELLGFLAGDPPLFPAGTGWAYSDSHYILLGALLERVTSQKYERLLENRLLRPLGLKNSLPAESRVMPGVVQGYAGPDNPFGGTDAMLHRGRMAFNPQNEWTGGGVASTPADLVRWLRALLQGPVLKPESRALMATGVPAPPLGPDARYGLGLILRPTRLGPCIGHTGFFPGYQTWVGHFPEQDTTVAIQVNTSAPGALSQPLGELAMALVEAATRKPAQDRVP